MNTKRRAITHGMPPITDFGIIHNWPTGAQRYWHAKRSSQKTTWVKYPKAVSHFISSNYGMCSATCVFELKRLARMQPHIQANTFCFCSDQIQRFHRTVAFVSIMPCYMESANSLESSSIWIIAQMGEIFGLIVGGPTPAKCIFP